MYPALRLQQTREDAVEVFARLLDVFGELALVEFEGLEDVARLPLVADADGHDVQVCEGLDLVALLTHAEHLDDALVGGVDTILRAAVALGNPYALALLADGVADILGEVERGAVEILDAAARTLDLEHLVTLADVDDQLVHHQVGTKGYLGGVKALHDEEVLQETGVEHDVAVVAHVEVALLGIEPFDAVAGKLGDALGNHTFIDHSHGLGLEVAHGLVAGDALSDGLQGLVGTDVGCQQGERAAVGDARHGIGDLLLIIGTDVVELRVFKHIVLLFVYSGVNL